MAPEEQEGSSPITCQLKKYELPQLMLRDQMPEPPVNTPAEWFSKRYPTQAAEFGCPFLETTYTDQFQQHVNPIALNEIFFAAILCGDESLGHRVVFYTPDQQFYFRDVRADGVFKPTTEDKLMILLSVCLLRCAEELTDPTPKFNLFTKFRKDEELQKVVEKAKSLLAVDRSFFEVDSPNARVLGAECYGKAAQSFIKVVIEMNPQKSLTVSDSYTAFREFCIKNGLMLVDRSLFQDLVGEIIEKEFGLGVRNDVLNPLGKQQRGWKGLGLREDINQTLLAVN